MKPVLIIKTGSTLKGVPQTRGDFEHWIQAVMGLSDPETIVCNVMAGEILPKLAEVSALVITGSAAMVTDKLPWSQFTENYLREAVIHDLPILGICYGHQLLAHALGGLVAYHPRGREIGTTSINLTSAAATDLLFNDLPFSFKVNTSHMQTVTQLPVGATVLASNDFESHHAVHFGGRVWGVQFHPEFALDIMQTYLTERAPALKAEGLDVEQLQASVSATPIAASLLQLFAALVHMTL